MNANTQTITLLMSDKLSQMLAGEKEAGNDKYDIAGAMVADIITHLNQLDGLDRILQFHLEIDHALTFDIKNNPNPVSCTKGCAHCCCMNVDVFDDEARLYAAMIHKRQIKINKKLFKRAKNMSREDIDNNPMPCIFLKNNQCSIYEYRPAGCRKYFITGPASACEIDGINDVVPILALPFAEMVYSAMLNISPMQNDGYDSLAYKINKYL